MRMMNLEIMWIYHIIPAGREGSGHDSRMRSSRQLTGSVNDGGVVRPEAWMVLCLRRFFFCFGGEVKTSKHTRSI